ncbi:hypothetical protein, partial [Escherichia coli]|uniref:hypothetical protein n=1 Tax=Escherichia coli TaxID=562 RepID=UPI001BC8C500
DVFAGKKSAQIREILINESAWEEMTCLFAPSLILTRRNHSAGIKLLSYKLIQINPGYLLYLSPVIRYSSS